MNNSTFFNAALSNFRVKRLLSRLKYNRTSKLRSSTGLCESDLNSEVTIITGTNAAFTCGGIDGKLGGLTPMNSYARLVCIRGIKTNVIGISL